MVVSVSTDLPFKFNLHKVVALFMMKWKEIRTNFPVSRSSHKISVVGDTLYMFGGEHEARTPIGKLKFQIFC